MKLSLKKVESIVGKGENVGNNHLPLFKNTFKRLYLNGL